MVFFTENGLKMIYDFITPFERVHFELPEKLKSTFIGYSEVNLWLSKVLHLPNLIIFSNIHVICLGFKKCGM